jgi:hypothetical protein
VAERSEAGWGITQRVVDQRQDAFHVPIHFVVPETQHSEAVGGKLTVTSGIAPSMGIVIVLTAINFDDETVPETDEIHDMASARGLAAEVEALLSPRPQMNSQLHLLRRHSFAKTASDFVSHDPPPGRALRARPPSPFGGGI